MRRADRPLLGVIAAGGLISLYLTWLHYSETVALCLGVSGCETVQTSRYAELGGTPVALLGLFFFGLAGGLVLRGGGRDGARLALFGLALTATIFAGYLGWLELFVIGAVCPWCVAVAACVVAVLTLAARGLARPSTM